MPVDRAQGGTGSDPPAAPVAAAAPRHPARHRRLRVGCRLVPGRGHHDPGAAAGPVPGRLRPPWHCPAGIQSLRDVDCPSASRCWAVGTTLGTARSPASAAVLTTTTGGATWTVQPIPADRRLPGRHRLPDHEVLYRRRAGRHRRGGARGRPHHRQRRTRPGCSSRVPAGTTDVTAVACPPAGHVLGAGRRRRPGDHAGARAHRGHRGSPGGRCPPRWRPPPAWPAPTPATAGPPSSARSTWATSAGAVAATADGGATWALADRPVRDRRARGDRLHAAGVRPAHRRAPPDRRRARRLHRGRDHGHRPPAPPAPGRDSC